MSKKDAGNTPPATTDSGAEVVPAPRATGTAEAAADEEVTPRNGSRVRATVNGALGVFKRKRVLIAGGVALLVGFNVAMAVAVDGWRSEDAGLRAQNERLGLSLAEAQATATTQAEEISLVTDQAAAAQRRRTSSHPSPRPTKRPPILSGQLARR